MLVSDFSMELQI